MSANAHGGCVLQAVGTAAVCPASSDLPPLISNAGSLATFVAMRHCSSAESRPAAFRRRRPSRRRGVLHREGSRRAKARVRLFRASFKGLRSSPQRLNCSSIKGCSSFASDQLGRSPLWRSKGGRPNVVRVKIDASVSTRERMRKCDCWAIDDRRLIAGPAWRGDRLRQHNFPDDEALSQTLGDTRSERSPTVQS